MMRTSVIRKSHFNAAHRLFNPKWSDEKNQNVFGLCNNKNFHGHNYELEIKVTGEIDPDTGYVYDMKLLADLIKDEVERDSITKISIWMYLILKTLYQVQKILQLSFTIYLD
jgi:6-pyruvoyl-tetrahydropterin synthase